MVLDLQGTYIHTYIHTYISKYSSKILCTCRTKGYDQKISPGKVGQNVKQSAQFPLIQVSRPSRPSKRGTSVADFPSPKSVPCDTEFTQLMQDLSKAPGEAKTQVGMENSEYTSWTIIVNLACLGSGGSNC